MPSAKKSLSEPQFRELLLRFSKKSKAAIDGSLEKSQDKWTVITHAGMTMYEEAPPSFSSPGWAAWWAFRLLHPERLADFDVEIRALFEDFKKSGRPWITYNEEKRSLLARYLREPYEPPKPPRRKR